MPPRKRRDGAGQRVVEPGGGRTLLRPIGLVVFLVEVLVVPVAASPFRAPKMVIALSGIALTLFLPAVLSLWAGAMPKIRSRLIWPILAFPALQLLSVAWAVDRPTAIVTAAATAIWCLAILLLALMGREAIGRIALWAAAGAAVSAAVGLLQLLHLPLLIVEGEKGRMAVTGLTGNPADLAMAALLLLPLLLFASGGPSARPRRVHLGLGGFLLASAVATQTFAALAAGGLVVFVWLARQRSRRLSAAVAILTVIVVGSAAIGGVPHRLGTAFRQIRQGDWYQLFSARADGWTAALEMIRRNPVTGVGAGGFGHQFYPARLAWLEAHGGHGARGEISTHFQWAHCDPLQLLGELGIPGLLWLAALVALFLPRTRGDPVAVAGLAAALPFLLLHYPTHLAVGLLPLTLLLAHILAGEPVQRPGKPPVWQRPAAVVALAAVLMIGWWQLDIARGELWRGSLERVLRQAVTLPEPGRNRALNAVAQSIRGRMATHPREFPWLSVSLGNALLAAGDPAGAETVFRETLDRAPSATSELGLGLALAAQGRTPEALEHLSRAGRVNPMLLDTVADPELRNAARKLSTVK